MGNAPLKSRYLGKARYEVASFAVTDKVALASPQTAALHSSVPRDLFDGLEDLLAPPTKFALAVSSVLSRQVVYTVPSKRKSASKDRADAKDVS